jgi:hypothetical protein
MRPMSETTSIAISLDANPLKAAFHAGDQCASCMML